MRTGKVLALGLCWLAAMTGAETACYRLVRTLPARGTRHSAKTLEAWKVWGEAHPDWRPKRSAEEQLRELDIACAYVALETAEEPDLLLTEEPAPPSYELASAEPPPASTDVPGWGPSNDDGDSGDEGLGGPTGGGGYPLQYPVFGAGGPTPPPSPPPVPEPASLLLLGTGLVAAALWRKP